jgi:transcriptional regulator with XRE-family HTH domain
MAQVMKVVRETAVDVPNLGQRIEQARKADPRSLKALCDAIGMSTMNWYRIEREQQDLPEETLRKIEAILGVDFGVKFKD